MDFEHAAQRLKRDQSKMMPRRGPQISTRAAQEAELRKRQQQRMAADRQRQKQQAEYRDRYYQQCERSLGVKQLSAHGKLLLTATSIHGDGDKIALPPSALEYLTRAENTDNMSQSSESPWIFRIAIPNPEYIFPASPLLQQTSVPEDDDEMDEDDNDDEDDEGFDRNAAYLDELRHRYISYTHGTVVEFTQDEGHIGLPRPIAAVLLHAARGEDEITGRTVPATRTVDPSRQRQTDSGDEMPVEDGGGDHENGNSSMETDEEKTPGHLAYGLFDVPNVPVEVSLVHIPKGKACKLRPTAQAISNGFYNLKNVKLVLEQSLIRTRATLSLGDVVHTWHRGVKYDLTVSQVTPSTYQTITCINTDIEVEFDEAPAGIVPESNNTTSAAPALTGYTLGSSVTSTRNAAAAATHSSLLPVLMNYSKLLEEPPSTQTEGVLTVQIRSPDGGHGRRRFDICRATIQDLFAFASTVTPSTRRFQLVTRFPRTIVRMEDNDAASQTLLQEAGLQAGQELFMVEAL